MSPHRFDRFKRWERHVALPDGAKIFVRPIRPEDETLYPAFLTAVTQDDLRLRFFAPVKELSHSAIARFTQIDYARAMAFIAIEEATGQMLGVVRIHANSEHRSCEYTILVRSDLKGTWSRLALDGIDGRIRACGRIGVGSGSGAAGK
jgi:acetyltransferase